MAFKITSINQRESIITNNFINDEIFDIKDLVTADTNNITFFHSKKYETLASKTFNLFCYNKKSMLRFWL